MGTCNHTRFSLSSSHCQLERRNGSSGQLLGFTLIELLVVIAVSGVLLAVGISRLNPTFQINRGNDAKRKATLAKIQFGMEQYRSDNGNYPVTSTGLTALYQGTPKYLNGTPNGVPKSTDVYTYAATPSGCDNVTIFCTGYTLYACLENLKDTALDTLTDNQAGVDKCAATGVISHTVTSQ